MGGGETERFEYSLLFPELWLYQETDKETRLSESR